MRKLLLVLVILICPLSARPYWKGGNITSDGVRLRSGPNLQAAVVANLPRGQFLGVLERKNGWTKVFFPHAFMLAERLNGEVVGEGGADLLLEPNEGSPVLATLKSGAQVDMDPSGQPYRQTSTPESLNFWVADEYVSTNGLPLRPQDYAPGSSLKIGNSDWTKLTRLDGLHLIVLPTDAPGSAELTQSDEGRFGPSYTVRYRYGEEWMEISAATAGLGGYGVNEEEFVISAGLLGKLLVGKAGAPQNPNFMTEGTPIGGGSTADGKPFPLTVFFYCSPGMDRQIVRRSLASLRASRI